MSIEKKEEIVEDLLKEIKYIKNEFSDIKKTLHNINKTLIAILFLFTIFCLLVAFNLI